MTLIRTAAIATAVFLLPLASSAQKKKAESQGPQTFNTIYVDYKLPNDQMALVQQIWFDKNKNGICDSTEHADYNIQMQVGADAIVEIDLVKDKKDSFPTLHVHYQLNNGAMPNTDEIFFKDKVKTDNPKNFMLKLLKEDLPIKVGAEGEHSLVPLMAAFIHLSKEVENPSLENLTEWTNIYRNAILRQQIPVKN